MFLPALRVGAFALLFSLCGFAQTITSSIVGVVKDASGSTISNAELQATNTATNERKQARSDGSGKYLLLNLSPGSYSVEATAQGFSKYVQEGVVLNVNQQAQLDVNLTIGQVSDQVTVQSDVSAIQTTTSDVADTVDNKAILNLPLNTRNAYSLVYLTPGVAGSIGNNYNSINFSINGARSSFTDFLVDGVPAGHPTVQGYAAVAVFPSVDAVAEFKVEGQNYEAEFGRAIGGVLNVIYKTGTNSFHGTAYDFLRNSVLDANNYFANAAGRDLGSFKRNQFGGVLNGPIKKDKTFFLLSTELLRQNSFNSTNTTVPTLRQREGDFSQTFAANGQLIRIFDPLTTRSVTTPQGTTTVVRDQFLNNRIPLNRINPVAANVTRYYPLPNATGNSLTQANNYFSTGTDRNDINSWDVRVDHNFTEQQKFFGRYSNRTVQSTPAQFFPDDLTIAEGRIIEQNFSRAGVLGYTATLSPTLIVDARAGFARTLYQYGNQGRGFTPSTLGLPADLNTAGSLALFPVMNSAGYVNLGSGGDRQNAFMTYSANASVTKIAGSHTLKAGWDGRMLRVNNREYSNTSGAFTFGTNFTQGPNPNVASATAGNGYASLLACNGTGNLVQNFKDVASQSFYHAWYFEDQWRVTEKLTLNLGIRYDLDTPRTERYNRMNYFDPSAPSPLANVAPGLSGGLVFVGVNGNPRTQYKWDRNNIAPRFGFAYAANTKTVIRGGFANIYGASPQQASGTVGPFGWRVQTDWISSLDGITPLNSLSNPFPNGFAPVPGATNGLATGAGGSLQAFLRDTVTPYSSQWNLTVERQLPFSMTLQAAYVGNRGLQLQRNNEGGLNMNQIDPRYLSLGQGLNQLVANPFFGTVNNGILANRQVSRGQLLRPYPQFTSITPLYSSGASSNYHGLQIRFKKRFSSGLQFGGSYVWSKAIDEASNHQNSYFTAGERAVSSLDFPHRFVANYIYELPFGRGRRFGSQTPMAVNLILGGWQVNGFTTIQSGSALQITANNTAGLDNPTLRANTNGQYAALSGDIHNRLNRYFDTSTFSQPLPFTFGNTPAYISNLRGHYTNNTDLSLFKEFYPRETVRVQFRAEAFNAFNRVKFGNPNTSVTAANFGIINTQDNTPRQIQFGLKVLF